MMTVYNVDVDRDILEHNLIKILNQTYRLLPIREEGQDWKRPLQTLIVEVAGLYGLFKDQEELFLTLWSKMQGILELDEEEDFFSYRRSIFECCNIIDKIKQKL